MESHGLPDRIHVTRAVRDRLADRYAFEPRGVIDVKGKGPMETFFLLERLDVTAPRVVREAAAAPT
jgi:class 3 adenylate cyclase